MTDHPPHRGLPLMACLCTIEQAMSQTTVYGWVEYTYPDYAIVNIGGAYYRANYQLIDGEVTVAPIGEWPRVEREWMAPGTKAAPARDLTPSIRAAMPSRNRSGSMNHISFCLLFRDRTPPAGN